jgi:hypothetical protein
VEIGPREAEGETVLAQGERKWWRPGKVLLLATMAAAVPTVVVMDPCLRGRRRGPRRCVELRRAAVTTWVRVIGEKPELQLVSAMVVVAVLLLLLLHASHNCTRAATTLVQATCQRWMQHRVMRKLCCRAEAVAVVVVVVELTTAKRETLPCQHGERAPMAEVGKPFHSGMGVMLLALLKAIPIEMMRVRLKRCLVATTMRCVIASAF